MAFHCQKCGKEARQLYAIGGEKLCDSCFKPIKQERKKVWDEFIVKNKRVIEVGKTKERPDLDPEKYPVAKWIVDLLEKEPMTRDELIRRMTEYGYAKGTMYSQLRRVGRDYVLNGLEYSAKKVEA